MTFKSNFSSSDVPEVDVATATKYLRFFWFVSKTAKALTPGSLLWTDEKGELIAIKYFSFFFGRFRFRLLQQDSNIRGYSFFVELTAGYKTRFKVSTVTSLMMIENGNSNGVGFFVKN